MEGDQSKKRIDEWITRAKRHLAVRSRQKPITKAGQLRALWPEIQLALDQGQTLKAVRDWLAEQGLVFRGGNFRTYVLRVRRERSKKAVARFLEAAMSASVEKRPKITHRRPLASLFSRRDRISPAVVKSQNGEAMTNDSWALAITSRSPARRPEHE